MKTSQESLVLSFTEFEAEVGGQEMSRRPNKFRRRVYRRLKRMLAMRHSSSPFIRFLLRIFIRPFHGFRSFLLLLHQRHHDDLYPELSLGKKGVATTKLAARGEARFNSKTYTVNARRGIILPNQQVEIVNIQGSLIEVVAA